MQVHQSYLNQFYRHVSMCPLCVLEDVIIKYLIFNQFLFDLFNFGQKWDKLVSHHKNLVYIFEK